MQTKNAGSAARNGERPLHFLGQYTEVHEEAFRRTFALYGAQATAETRRRGPRMRRWDSTGPPGLTSFDRTLYLMQYCTLSTAA
jgi:hypothetical protein